MESQRRVILGIVGPPAAGKSTLAQSISSRIEYSAVLPMDGFHLAQQELQRLGLEDRKGAPETFDVAGLVALVSRLRSGDHATIYAPDLNREIDEPIAGSIAIPVSVQLVIAEGNYLHLGVLDWARLRLVIDEFWYIECDSSTRRGRLIDRYRKMGWSEEKSAAKADGVDTENARLIEAARDRTVIIV